MIAVDSTFVLGCLVVLLFAYCVLKFYELWSNVFRQHFSMEVDAPARFVFSDGTTSPILYPVSIKIGNTLKVKYRFHPQRATTATGLRLLWGTYASVKIESVSVMRGDALELTYTATFLKQYA